MPYGDESRGGETFLTTVTQSNPEESLTKGMDVCVLSQELITID